MIEFLSRPWPWWVAGPLIGLVVPFVYWFGARKWGISSSLRHACAAVLPAGLPYFKYDWRTAGGWHLSMAAGIVVGGLLGGRVLSDPDAVVVRIADRVRIFTFTVFSLCRLSARTVPKRDLS